MALALHCATLNAAVLIPQDDQFVFEIVEVTVDDDDDSVVFSVGAGCGCAAGLSPIRKMCTVGRSSLEQARKALSRLKCRALMRAVVQYKNYVTLITN